MSIVTESKAALVRANPERLHELFDDKGGFDRFVEAVDLPVSAARLIWDDPNRESPKRIRFTLRVAAAIADDLGTSWEQVITKVYDLDR